jgi:hypothetical protein
MLEAALIAGSPRFAADGHRLRRWSFGLAGRWTPPYDFTYRARGTPVGYPGCAPPPPVPRPGRIAMPCGRCQSSSHAAAICRRPRSYLFRLDPGRRHLLHEPAIGELSPCPSMSTPIAPRSAFTYRIFLLPPVFHADGLHTRMTNARHEYSDNRTVVSNREETVTPRAIVAALTMDVRPVLHGTWPTRSPIGCRAVHQRVRRLDSERRGCGGYFARVTTPR